MENVIKGTTKGGQEWIPHFIATLEQESCIGCARCYKVCSREVFAPLQIDPDDEEDEDPRMVMEITDPSNCIGCEACERVCARQCHTFAPAGLSQ